jgi:hypothetical protein
MEKSEAINVVAMIRVLQYIRDSPGETSEQIMVAMTRQFGERMDISPAWMSHLLNSYEVAGFIRHTHNAEHECVWLHVDPAPVKKADLREVTIETVGSRYQAHTDVTPEELAESLFKTKEGFFMFQDVSGRDFFIVRAEHVAAVAFGPEVASALQ